MKTIIKAVMLSSSLLAGAQAFAREMPGNPDRFVSVGLNYDRESLEGGYGPTAGGDTYLKVGEYENRLATLETDIRIPMSNSLTLMARIKFLGFEQRFNSNDQNLLSSDITDQSGTGFGIGIRYYFNR